MSGPIVRKYGFPNFEKIFGERGLQHGVDDEANPAADEAEAPADEAAAETKKSPKKTAKSKKGSK